MKLHLVRTKFGIGGIFGELSDEDTPSNILAFTCEHAYLAEDGKWAAKVPEGAYTCKRRLSPHFGYEVFELTDVPGHDFIEIHIGNTGHDSDGCILLGMSIIYVPGTMLLNSRGAFDSFMERMEGIDTFTLEVKNVGDPLHDSKQALDTAAA